MTPRGGLAFANARMRAWKSRLLSSADAALLLTASDDVTMHRAVSALGVEDPHRRLLRIYETAIDSYPFGQPLFFALLALREIENVKLLWRVTVNPRHQPEAVRLWLDLGPLARVTMVNASTVRELAEKLARTPYAEIAATVARAHGNDLAAAELALDRWASARVMAEARKLPCSETLTWQMLELLVRERDSEIVRRGPKWYGLASVSGEADDVTTLRKRRLRLCRRAFVGSPFLLAPAIAVILLAEEEVRAVEALVERRGDETLDAPLLRAAAASQVGA